MNGLLPRERFSSDQGRVVVALPAGQIHIIGRGTGRTGRTGSTRRTGGTGWTDCTLFTGIAGTGCQDQYKHENECDNSSVHCEVPVSSTHGAPSLRVFFTNYSARFSTGTGRFA
jgi:hypothetical protein